MKKKWVFIVIGLLLVVGIGGKVYMDKKEERKEAEKIEAERMSVEALKNTFADIKSVEFEAIEYTVMTGYYDMFVKMTNINGEFVRFSYSFTTNHPNEIDSWRVVDKEKVQKKGQTKNKVKVIYTDGSEEEI
ncbi:hypothetical protein FHP05_12135 [Cerasibacillus terrae]|uniref:DUF1433 domain-containing protein n=1 Tax=Cerasibacillus terrae TaxID=2498845 RepID=A0A5C8NMX6_9BACI|nr:hypothetical protein [Cerasibacillus terrae]TXL62548.1 hypothetical protein FHP05_12135 [Cerasibacillus terrae]